MTHIFYSAISAMAMFVRQRKGCYAHAKQLLPENTLTTILLELIDITRASAAMIINKAPTLHCVCGCQCGCVESYLRHVCGKKGARCRRNVHPHQRARVNQLITAIKGGYMSQPEESLGSTVSMPLQN